MNIHPIINTFEGTGAVDYNGYEIKFANKLFDNGTRSIFVSMENNSTPVDMALLIIHKLEKTWAPAPHNILVMMRKSFGFKVLNILQKEYIVVATGKFCSLHRWSLSDETMMHGVSMIKIKPTVVISGTASTVAENGVLVE